MASNGQRIRCCSRAGKRRCYQLWSGRILFPGDKPYMAAKTVRKTAMPSKYKSTVNAVGKVKPPRAVKKP